MTDQEESDQNQCGTANRTGQEPNVSALNTANHTEHRHKRSTACHQSAEHPHLRLRKKFVQHQRKDCDPLAGSQSAGTHGTAGSAGIGICICYLSVHGKPHIFVRFGTL